MTNKTKILHSCNKKNTQMGAILLMAETMGFEPMRQGFPTYSLSRGAPSATQPSLHLLKDYLNMPFFRGFVNSFFYNYANFMNNKKFFKKMKKSLKKS